MLTEYVAMKDTMLHNQAQQKFSAGDQRSKFLKSFLESNNTEKVCGY